MPRALPWTPRSMPDGQGLRPCRAAFRFPSGRAEVGGRSGVSVGSARPSSCAGANEAASDERSRMYFIIGCSSDREVLHAIPHRRLAACTSVALLIREATSRSVSSLGVGPQAFSHLKHSQRHTTATTDEVAHGRFECLTHTATNRGTTDHNESYRNTEPVGLTQRPAATLVPPPRRAERSLDAALHA